MYENIIPTLIFMNNVCVLAVLHNASMKAENMPCQNLIWLLWVQNPIQKLLLCHVKLDCSLEQSHSSSFLLTHFALRFIIDCTATTIHSLSTASAETSYYQLQEQIAAISFRPRSYLLQKQEIFLTNWAAGVPHLHHLCHPRHLRPLLGINVPTHLSK